MSTRHLGNVLDPRRMAVRRVGRQAKQLDAALGELGLELGKGAQLGGAHGREVLRVGEQDGPAALDVAVEVDLADVAVGGEVGGLGAETERAANSHGEFVREGGWWGLLLGRGNCRLRMEER